MKKQKNQNKVRAYIMPSPQWLLCFMLLISSISLFAQQKTISGNVKDSNGEPLIGVTVVLNGTQTGTVTDVDGNYSIQAPTNGKLLFSYVGMESKEENIDGRAIVNVVLADNSITLGNVVVTALGIKREEKALGYAVQKVDGDMLQTVKGLNVGTSLSGKVAGMKVLNSTEFASEPTISIRGEKPLLVIDGIPYKNLKLSDIAADNIEEISILKGATASALYGENGKSGAIMITTKKGSQQQGFSVNINSSTMFTAGYLAIPESQSVFGRGTTGIYNRTSDRVWGQEMNGVEVEQWDPISKSLKMMPYLPVGKDNFKNFIEQGYVTNNNVSVQQQGELGSLRASANWTQNKGQYPNSRINKYSFTLGGEMKYQNFTLSSSMGYSKKTAPNAGFNGYKNYDPMYSLLIWTGADYDVRQYEDYWVIKDEKQNNSYDEVINTLDNPYFHQYERTRSLNRDVFNGMVNAGYAILPWLKAGIRLGLDYYTDNQDVKISKGSFTGSGEDYGWAPKLKGHFAQTKESGYSINSDFMLTANKTIKKFTIEGLTGGAISYLKDETMSGSTVDGISIPGYFSLKASNKEAGVSSGVSAKQVNSIFGRIGGSWNGMLYTDATLRNDWNSTLSKDNRSYLYPSVSGSFIVSEVLPKKDWLSIWKIRSSWTVSKFAADIYDNNIAYGISKNVWGNLPSASLPASIKKSNVKPTTTATFEIGSMASFFDARLSFDFAYYNKNLYNRIVSANISPATGYTKNFVNTKEEISTRGIELTLKGTPIETKDLQLDITTNWTKYARYYNNIDEQFSADKPWIKKGERVDHYVIRDFQRTSDGDIIHNNGLPLYSAYDSLWGYTDPDWIWGVGFNLRYKDFTLSASFDGRIGGMTPTITEAYMWLAGSHPNSVVPERYRDSQEALEGNGAYKGVYVGQGVKITSGSVTYDTYGNIINDTRVYASNDIPVTYKRYIEGTHKNFIWGGSPSPLDVYSTTFFKLREISLTYSLPKNLVSKILCKDATISFVGQNVLLWAKDFKYSDPDGGTENLSDPSQRYLGFNINLNF